MHAAPQFGQARFQALDARQVHGGLALVDVGDRHQGPCHLVEPAFDGADRFRVEGGGFAGRCQRLRCRDLDGADLTGQGGDLVFQTGHRFLARHALQGQAHGIHLVGQLLDARCHDVGGSGSGAVEGAHVGGKLVAQRVQARGHGLLALFGDPAHRLAQIGSEGGAHAVGHGLGHRAVGTLHLLAQRLAQALQFTRQVVERGKVGSPGAVQRGDGPGDPVDLLLGDHGLHRHGLGDFLLERGHIGAQCIQRRRHGTDVRPGRGHGGRGRGHAGGGERRGGTRVQHALALGDLRGERVVLGIGRRRLGARAQLVDALLQTRKVRGLDRRIGGRTGQALLDLGDGVLETGQSLGFARTAVAAGRRHGTVAVGRHGIGAHHFHS